MFQHLDIADPRERRIVGAADAALGAVAPIVRLSSRRAGPAVDRILLLRLERIGDLIMTLGAIQAVRRLAPAAEIHLAVGSWNAALARLIRGVDRVHTLDLPWLARTTPGRRPAIIGRGLAWRRERYDLAINFEPDIRSNLLLALTGAPRRIGFASAGGGPLLTDPVEHDQHVHTSANALRLVERAFGRPAAPAAGSRSMLVVPAVARDAAGAILEHAARQAGYADGLDGRILAGIHPSGGRAIKQWHPERFAEVASRVARRHGAVPVLTGTEADRRLVASVRAALGPDVTAIDLTGTADLVVLAGILERMAILVTGDTGPMHLADAVGTPAIAVFGPSDPARYAPMDERARVVRVDLPCSPCNRIRQPPARCLGHVPDCLDGIDVDRVSAAVDEVLAGTGRVGNAAVGWRLVRRPAGTEAKTDP